MRVDRIKKTDVMLITGTIFFFAVLYIIQLNNYLLFHVFAEVFSIVIAFCVFIIVWNGRNYLKDNYLLLLGLAYLFIGFIDLLHVAGFPGMNIFQEYDYHSNQFWIAGRSIEALSFLSGILVNPCFCRQ